MCKIEPKFFWKVLVLAGLSCGTVVLSLSQVPVSEFAAHVDDHYNRMHTLRAQFAEVYQGAGLTRSEKGTLILKKSGQMLWGYNSPRPNTFITHAMTPYLSAAAEQ